MGEMFRRRHTGQRLFSIIQGPGGKRPVNRSGITKLKAVELTDGHPQSDLAEGRNSLSGSNRLVHREPLGVFGPKNFPRHVFHSGTEIGSLLF